VAVLAAEAITLAFGPKVIFDEANLAIEPGDRVGVVGPNGTGKSTLLKILADRVEPDAGRVVRSKGVRVGYLAQEHADPGEGRLLDSVLATAPGREVVAARLEAAEAAMAEAEDPHAQLELAAELAELHAELSMLEFLYAPHRAQQILAGLGFAESDVTRPLREFSGGWRMRAALAGLLYQQPDVLLLDEPTNHLDLPSVAWLSSYLRGFKKALVLTCHDRGFLNRHVARVATLELEGLKVFRGNYDAYLVQRELEIAHLEARQRSADQKKKELEAFVTRFKAKASKARQAQSKAKQLERLEAEQIVLPELRRAVRIDFKPCARAGETVIKVDGLSFSYGDKPVLRDVNLDVRRGDRVAVVGVNGAGKTTLLKLVCHELEPTSGAVSLGHNVSPSYFAQHQAEVLGSNQTVLESVVSAAPEVTSSEARSLCGAFLFSGDDVDKSISVLSGGEKTRVALARMLARPGNLLLLDEPTNHLDTDAADKLTESLEGYDGTLLFVSHNLDFARRLSNKVWDVKSGGVEVYPGSLGEYLDHLERQSSDEEAPSAAAPKLDKQARLEARAKERDAQRARAKLERQVADAEAEVARLEAEQAEVEAKLADPAGVAPEAMSGLAKRYEAIKRELDAAMERWAALGEALSG